MIKYRQSQKAKFNNCTENDTEVLRRRSKKKHLAKERGIGGLTEGTEKQHYWFGFPFVDQIDMSDAMQSVVSTNKLGKERMGTSELKSYKNKLRCAKK